MPSMQWSAAIGNMAWTGLPSIRSCLGEGCGHWWWRFTRLPSQSQVLELTTQLNSTQHTAHSHTARCLSSPPLTRLTPPCNTCLKTTISARMQMCARAPFYHSQVPQLTTQRLPEDHQLSGVHQLTIASEHQHTKVPEHQSTGAKMHRTLEHSSTEILAHYCTRDRAQEH